MFFFDKEEVYIGYSLEDVSKIINILSDKNIKYDYKVMKYLNSSDRFTFKRVGINMDYETQYTISVKNKNYEEARYLVNKVLHPIND